LGFPERRESIRRLDEIKAFFRRNSRGFLVAGLFTLVFSVLALVHGIGFTATVKITSSQLLVPTHPCHGYICDGTINVSFNPFLYPINHLFGSEVSAEFILLSEPYDSKGESVKEIMTTRTLLSEFPINIPFFYVAGFILALGLEKAIYATYTRARI